jgi:hypothetical protein
MLDSEIDTDVDVARQKARDGLTKTSGCEIAQAVSAACPARLLLIVVVG